MLPYDIFEILIEAGMDWAQPKKMIYRSSTYSLLYLYDTRHLSNLLLKTAWNVDNSERDTTFQSGGPFAIGRLLGRANPPMIVDFMAISN